MPTCSGCRAAIILTRVKIFQFLPVTCRVSGRHATGRKENLTAHEYMTQKIPHQAAGYVIWAYCEERLFERAKQGLVYIKLLICGWRYVLHPNTDWYNISGAASDMQIRQV